MQESEEETAGGQFALDSPEPTLALLLTCPSSSTSVEPLLIELHWEQLVRRQNDHKQSTSGIARGAG